MDQARVRFYINLYPTVTGWFVRREIVLDDEPVMAYLDASPDFTTGTLSVHLDLQGPFSRFTDEESLRIVADVKFRSPGQGLAKLRIEGKPGYVVVKDIPYSTSRPDLLKLQVTLKLPLVPVASSDHPGSLQFLRAPGEKDEDKS